MNQQMLVSGKSVRKNSPVKAELGDEVTVEVEAKAGEERDDAGKEGVDEAAEAGCEGKEERLNSGDKAVKCRLESLDERSDGAEAEVGGQVLDDGEDARELSVELSHQAGDGELEVSGTLGVALDVLGLGGEALELADEGLEVVVKVGEGGGHLSLRAVLVERVDGSVVLLEGRLLVVESGDNVRRDITLGDDLRGSGNASGGHGEEEDLGELHLE